MWTKQFLYLTIILKVQQHCSYSNYHPKYKIAYLFVGQKCKSLRAMKLNLIANKRRINMITKLPASLDKSNVRVVEEKWNCAPQKIRLRLEVGIKDGDVVTLFDISVLHPLFESPSFVAIPVVSDLVFYVYSFACPSLYFYFHQILVFVVQY